MRKLAIYLWAILSLVGLSLVPISLAAQEEELSPEAQEFLDGLSPSNGTIEIADADATLDLGEDYIFYGADDAFDILVLAWGNTPESSVGVLGLVMPAGTNPLSDSWGAVVTFEDTGYVSDEDAADTDYDELMEQMQEGAAEHNAALRAEGYPGVDINGWAVRPEYDAASHSLVWARDLSFDGDEQRTLNYDVRSLGRRGVLSLNLVSKMSELDEIQIVAANFADHASFNEGARYQDFNSSTDRVAEYGLGGLVAAGVGVAVAKKLGILAVFLKFLKPILIGLVVLFGAFWGRIKRMLGMAPAEEEWYEEDEYAEEELAEAPLAAEAADPHADPNGNDGGEGRA